MPKGYPGHRINSLILKTGKPNLPLKTAIAGIGGFGSAHHGVFAKLEKYGTVRVVATCDPALDRLGEICKSHRFAERGVRVCRDFEEMLSTHPGQFDLGVVAAPIPLHARMHAAFLRSGAACYLEKPPTLDPQEFAQMLLVEESAPFPTNVGFAYVHLKDRLDLKRRMMTGEFGNLKRLSFLGLVQRSPSYFLRNNWAGKLLRGENLVLDSCLGNAMAHFLNNLLFFGNQKLLQGWARPTNMACELYRANSIEGTDTIFALARLDSGVELRIAATHACPNDEDILEETLEFEHATVTIRSANTVTIQRPGITHENFLISETSLASSLEHYCEFLTSNQARPAQTLRDCLGFVETNALFYLAGRNIHDLSHYTQRDAGTESVVSLPNVETAARRLIADALLPSEADFAWAKPGGRCDTGTLPELLRVVQTIRDSPE